MSSFVSFKKVEKSIEIWVYTGTKCTNTVKMLRQENHIYEPSPFYNLKQHESAKEPKWWKNTDQIDDQNKTDDHFSSFWLLCGRWACHVA